MCTRVRCSKCGKPGFRGCGAHVEQVLRDVPPAERCRCHEKNGSEKSDSTGSWLDRVSGLLGR